MPITARFARAVTGLSLVLTAALSVLWVALQPPVGGDGGLERLASLETAGATAALSVLAFAAAQLPLMIAALGIAQLARGRAPLLAIIAAGVTVLGAFGHTIVAGFQISQLAMAADTANHAVYAALLDSAPPAALGLAFTLGTLGTALGVVLLGVAVLRAGVGPRWVAYALWGFVLLEFAGTMLTTWATLAAGLLYLGAFAALAVTAWRSPLAVWQSTPFTPPRTRQRAAARAESAAPTV